MQRNSRTPLVCIVYPYVMHYRLPVFRALLSDTDFEFTVAAGIDLQDKSVKEVPLDQFRRRIFLNNHAFKSILFQTGLLRLILERKYDALIFLANPNILSTWLYALLARSKGVKVLFWTHGWIDAKRSGVKEKLRNLFYRLADHLLLYEERAKEIGVSRGFSPSKMTVIYNSLDFDFHETIFDVCSKRHPSVFCPDLSHFLPNQIYFCCVARLIPICRFELLISAVAEINRSTGQSFPVVLVGDGPERTKLVDLAVRLHVELVLIGETYDEVLIGSIVYHSRALVSPGKVGLSAVHGLTFGTPVITHGDFDSQMPEHAIIDPGVSGDYFRKDDSGDLAIVLARWAKKNRTGLERNACRDRVIRLYNPAMQTRLIKQSLTRELNA